MSTVIVSPGSCQQYLIPWYHATDGVVANNPALAWSPNGSPRSGTASSPAERPSHFLMWHLDLDTFLFLNIGLPLGMPTFLPVCRSVRLASVPILGYEYLGGVFVSYLKRSKPRRMQIRVQPVSTEHPDIVTRGIGFPFCLAACYASPNEMVTRQLGRWNVSKQRDTTFTGCTVQPPCMIRLKSYPPSSTAIQPIFLKMWLNLPASVFVFFFRQRDLHSSGLPYLTATIA